MHTRKPQMLGVVEHVEESDGAGVALRGVEPVAGPRIFADVHIAAVPHIESVERVIENRQPDSKQFEANYEGKAGQQLYLLGVGGRPFGGKGVGDEVLDRKSPTGTMPLSE